MVGSPDANACTPKNGPAQRPFFSWCFSNAEGTRGDVNTPGASGRSIMIRGDEALSGGQVLGADSNVGGESTGPCHL